MRKPFKATCDRCQQENERCLTIVLKLSRLYAQWRELHNYCPKCRKTTHGKWVWPETTVIGEKHARADKYLKKVI